MYVVVHLETLPNLCKGFTISYLIFLPNYVFLCLCCMLKVVMCLLGLAWPESLGIEVTVTCNTHQPTVDTLAVSIFWLAGMYIEMCF
jgi:hypothetical protein